MQSKNCNGCENGKISLGCGFKHPDDWKVVKDKSYKEWMSTIKCTNCKDGIIRPSCGFSHPENWRIIDCKFGDKCSNKKCKYLHM